jgi:hypothetical protein
VSDPSQRLKDAVVADFGVARAHEGKALAHAKAAADSGTRRGRNA